MNTYEKMVWVAENAKCGFHLTHNQHKDYYETAEQYLRERPFNDDFDEDVAKKMIELNEIWELQVYTRTPIGSYRLMHWSLEELVSQMYEVVLDELTPTK